MLEANWSAPHLPRLEVGKIYKTREGHIVKAESKLIYTDRVTVFWLAIPKGAPNRHNMRHGSQLGFGKHMSGKFDTDCDTPIEVDIVQEIEE